MKSIIDKRVIVFNGPPGVGKDTAVKHVLRHCRNKDYSRVAHNKMAGPLKNAVHALFDLQYSPQHYDEHRNEKACPNPVMFGMSPREGYIGLSEKAIKPWLGEDIFGRIQANIIHNDRKTQLYVFSDGGFVDEWMPVVDYIGAKNVYLVELHSSSTDWTGDSRKHIGDELKALYPDLHLMRLTNNITKDPFDKELFLMLVQGIVDKVLGW